MLLIECPYCGSRPEREFRYGGGAHISRPLDPAAKSDQEWADFLFFRRSPKGVHRERWMHWAGCRRWFNAIRDTLTYEILVVYKVGETAPPVPCRPDRA